jgi:hypothetical protein
MAILVSVMVYLSVSEHGLYKGQMIETSLWILLYMPLRSRLRNPTLTHYHRHFIGKHNSNKTAKRNYNLAENSRSVTGLVEIWPFVVKDIP